MFYPVWLGCKVRHSSVEESRSAGNGAAVLTRDMVQMEPDGAGVVRQFVQVVDLRRAFGIREDDVLPSGKSLPMDHGASFSAAFDKGNDSDGSWGRFYCVQAIAEEEMEPSLIGRTSQPRLRVVLVFSCAADSLFPLLSFAIDQPLSLIGSTCVL